MMPHSTLITSTYHKDPRFLTEQPIPEDSFLIYRAKKKSSLINLEKDIEYVHEFVSMENWDSLVPHSLTFRRHPLRTVLLPVGVKVHQKEEYLWFDRRSPPSTEPQEFYGTEQICPVLLCPKMLESRRLSHSVSGPVFSPLVGSSCWAAFAKLSRNQGERNDACKGLDRLLLVWQGKCQPLQWCDSLRCFVSTQRVCRWAAVPTERWCAVASPVDLYYCMSVGMLWTISVGAVRTLYHV